MRIIDTQKRLVSFHGTRLLSCYRTTGGDRLYVTTECDRSMTTIMLPEEY